MIESDSNGNFSITISGNIGGVGVDAGTTKIFNFNPTDSKFVRKVFNTNPQNTNKDAQTGIDTSGTNYYGYWLGETFENDIFNNDEVKEFCDA